LWLLGSIVGAVGMVYFVDGFFLFKALQFLL
jgi:hypothetical protein